MIRTGHRDDPPLTAPEAAEITRITALAALRGGIYTTRQQTRIDRILARARERAARNGV